MKTNYYPNRPQLFCIPMMILCLILIAYASIGFATSRMYSDAIFYAVIFVIGLITTVYTYATGKIKFEFDDDGISVIKGKKRRFYPWDTLKHGYVMYYFDGFTYVLLSCKALDSRNAKRIINRSKWNGKHLGDDYVIVHFAFYRSDKTVMPIKKILMNRFSEISKI